jgi:hypothetical protein
VPSSLQQIFDAHFDAYAASHRLAPREARAARCIRGCFTEAMGAHVLTCPAGHYERVQPHACRHRSCPRCAQAARARWVDAEFDRLLPCAHFHVVFTLPHELLALWEFNRSALAQLLFDCARSSLLALLADERHLGATPGLLMALHTWGRTLSRHPHVHCLVSAGGLDAAGAWRATRAGWLLPLEPLRRLFRGKLLGALWARLRNAQLALPSTTDARAWRNTIRMLWRRHFNVQICPPYDHGRGVVLYLARYAKGGPLPAERRLQLVSGSVRLDYTDHRDARTKTLVLDPDEFIARVLWHAAPRGSHTTRHAGLYSSSRAAQHRAARIALLDHSTHDRWPRTSPPHASPPALCPVCRSTLQRMQRQRSSGLSKSPMHQYGEFYGAPRLQPSSPTGEAQQVVQADAHRRAPAPRCGPPYRAAPRGWGSPVIAA